MLHHKAQDANHGLSKFHTWNPIFEIVLQVVFVHFVVTLFLDMNDLMLWEADMCSVCMVNR